MENNKVFKTDIIDEIVQMTNLNQCDVRKVVNAFFSITMAYLLKETKVEIRKFGVFKVSIRKSRRGYNPVTMESIIIPGKKTVTFTPSSYFKNELNRVDRS